MSGLTRRPIAALAAACMLSAAFPDLSLAGPNTAKVAEKPVEKPGTRAAFTAEDMAAARPAGLDRPV
ncbi:patatin, partial [Methylobacterium hispanicum]